MLIRHRGGSIVVQTPAKLNLFLEILGKRSDGYHELETLMVTVGLYDSLSFQEEVSGRIELQCFDGSVPCREAGGSANGEIPAGPDNLVVRAAELLRNHAGVAAGVRITLCKRIPAAAGLAGGSSDAAATLLALNSFWKLKLSVGDLQQLASRLGSDVGFFLSPVPAAICRGRGEQIDPLPLPLDLHFVIARPHSGLSTALVYSHCRAADHPRSVRHLADALKAGHLSRAARYLHNALQRPAEQLSTEVSQLRSCFSNQPVLGHMMSGSGTAYFGLCANRRQALLVAARMRAAQIGRVFVAQSRP